MLGKQVAGDNITVIDDGTTDARRHWRLRNLALRRRRPALAPHSCWSRTVCLNSYVNNTYTARKLNMKSTGNGSTGLAGNPGIGAGNFYLEARHALPNRSSARSKTASTSPRPWALSVNLVTGDYSQGASGLWIENGELAYPVEEITIAGNLKDMYREHRRHRQRSRLPQLRRSTHAPDRRHDHRRKLVNRGHETHVWSPGLIATRPTRNRP